MRDHRVGRAREADAAGQRAGINAREADLALASQPIAKGAFGAEAAGRGHIFANHAADRAIDLGYVNDFEWITGNAEKLPLPDDSVDVYTIAFGLRNVTRIDDALAEAKRVLKPGGRFYCLEFSQVREPFLARLYDTYSYHLIPKIGEIVAKDRDSYQYLVESIRKFPTREALIRRMEMAGFSRCRAESLTFGVVAIHEGVNI